MKLFNINKLNRKVSKDTFESNIELVEIPVKKPNQENPKYIEKTNVFRYKLWDKENSYIYKKVIERLYLGSLKRERQVHTSFNCD